MKRAWRLFIVLAAIFVCTVIAIELDLGFWGGVIAAILGLVLGYIASLDFAD
jgi:hypothetical protein